MPFSKEDLVTCITEYEREEVEWLLYPFIPFGCLTVLQGDPGCGKSIFMMNLTAKLTKGEALHDSGSDGALVRTDKSPVIYQSREDSYSKVIRPKLEDIGADINMVYNMKDPEDDLTVHDERIPLSIKATGAKLVIFDTLPKFLDYEEDIMHQGKLQPQLKILDRAARENDCAIVLISHMNKNEGSRAIYRGVGSIALAGFVRSNIMLEKTERAKRVLSVVKSNLDPDDIEDTYRLRRDGRYQFVGRTADAGDPKDWDDEPAASPAAEMMHRLLSNGSTPSKEVLEKMAESGFPKRQIDAAKKALGVRSVRRDDIWYMEL